MSTRFFTPPRVRAAAQATVLGLMSGMLLAACAPAGDAPTAAQQPEATTPTPAPEQAPAADAPAPSAAGGTEGGDGSQIQLGPLSERDIADAALAGELACSFAEEGQAPLLFAKGVVGAAEPAQGVVKVSDVVEQVRAPGGFEGMNKNPTFTGRGTTIHIVETGTAPGGGESPPRPATLTYQRGDGASRSFEGMWQCGP
ncbi:hypothetical protein MNO14_15170 [Luteimonas sp. S4-F44]|uniref:hypothetical protein n=1 Tax=Luteimonas sp. S4-F44 TaxID=2925842 RepID=UPI001F53699F|nr:hypothetical protein [Luteimonas sp. S4-F44]UNK42264.1 hypothetical protein MNO14_15170 [Luteimonas sp. S4-F44]